MKTGIVTVLLGLVCLFPHLSFAHGMEVFAKASVSKNHIDRDEHIVSVSGATGLAIALFSQFKVEARYTVISQMQNKMVIGYPTVLATLNDVKTQTNIYSVGFDIDILSDKSAFQPYIYVGAGYVETERSYYVTLAGETTATLESDPTKRNVSANVGLGFKLAVAKSVLFEVESLAYALDPHKPNPLINFYLNAGIRLLI